MTDIDQLAHKATGSLQPVSIASRSLLRKAGYPAISPEKEALATAAVMILFGSYRRDEAAAVEIFREAMVAVLCEYPDDCIRHVTDPRTGVQSYRYVSTERVGQETRDVRGKFKSFPPNAGELQEACESYMAPIRREIARDLQARRQEQDRIAEEQLEADRRNRPKRDEIAAKLAEAGYKLGDGRKVDQAPPPLRGDGKHALRVRSDLESRRGAPHG